MTTRTPLNCLAAILVLLFSQACHKSSNPPSPVVPPPIDTVKTPTTPVLGTMNINLTYPNGYSIPVASELIIIEPGGKVLLDTLVMYGTTLKATLKTNATLVDLVHVDTVAGLHNILAYKSVDPSKWNFELPYPVFSMGYVSQVFASSASIHCTHFPAVGTQGTGIYNTFFLNNGSVLSQAHSTYDPGGNNMDISYKRYPGAYNYLSIPQLGLYKLFVPSGDKDTVDLAHMDTAVSVSFTRTIPFTVNYSSTKLRGIVDSTNRKLDILLTDYYTSHVVSSVDLQYPRQSMQAYELMLNGTNTNNDAIGFYSWSKTVPTNPAMIDGSQVVVQNNLISNLAVKVNSKGATLLGSTWDLSGDIGTTLILEWNPDSTTLNPQAFLEKLNGKFLQGANISGLKCKSIGCSNVPGFSYVDYFNYTADTVKVRSHQMATASFYNKSFQ